MLKDSSLFTDLDKNDVDAMFSNLSAIYETHCTILDSMETSLKNFPNPPTYGTVFLNMVRTISIHLSEIASSF